MKKFVLAIFILILTAMSVAAESRYYTQRRGITSLYGYIQTPPYGAFTSCDPHTVKVNGVKYYMVIDNGGNYTYKSLLGCQGRKRYIMQSLFSLESDGDAEKLYASELQRAGIRFVKLKADGSLALKDKSQDLDMNKIGYIDLRRTRFSITAAPHGNFDIYIKRPSGRSYYKVIGHITAHSIRTAKRLFD